MSFFGSIYADSDLPDCFLALRLSLTLFQSNVNGIDA